MMSPFAVCGSWIVDEHQDRIQLMEPVAFLTNARESPSLLCDGYLDLHGADRIGACVRRQSSARKEGIGAPFSVWSGLGVFGFGWSARCSPTKSWTISFVRH